MPGAGCEVRSRGRGAVLPRPPSLRSRGTCQGPRRGPIGVLAASACRSVSTWSSTRKHAAGAHTWRNAAPEERGSGVAGAATRCSAPSSSSTLLSALCASSMWMSFPGDADDTENRLPSPLWEYVMSSPSDASAGEWKRPKSCLHRAAPALAFPQILRTHAPPQRRRGTQAPGVDRLEGHTSRRPPGSPPHWGTHAPTGRQPPLATQGWATQAPTSCQAPLAAQDQGRRRRPWISAAIRWVLAQTGGAATIIGNGGGGYGWSCDCGCATCLCASLLLRRCHLSCR